MHNQFEKKIVLVVRKTRLEELIVRYNTYGQAKFYIEHLGADFSDYEVEHQRYKAALEEAEQQLGKLGRIQLLDRKFLSNYIFDEEDTVVVLGQDGLVANTLKYLDGQHVIAVNPDPERWDGILLPFMVSDLSSIVPEVMNKRRNYRTITMAKAELNNGQSLYGVNDLFIGPKSHVSLRYEIELEGNKENHSSSGIIVSTGLGSTGWLKSILAGAKGIVEHIIGDIVKAVELPELNWGSNYLYFTVREPFPNRTSDATIVFGKITEGKSLRLVSQMPENGVIFSDGIESDFLEFNSGTEAIISVADKKGCLVV